jgi:hypothetical protein
MRARMRFVACTLVLLFAPARAWSDSARPPGWSPPRYTMCSASGAFCFTSDPAGPEGGRTWVHAAGAPESPTWVLPQYFAIAFLADDGEHLVTGYRDVNLLPIGEPEKTTIVSFWRKQALLRAYTPEELGYGRDRLQPTASHYVWGSYLGFGEDGRFRLVMIDKKEIAFDAETGKRVFWWRLRF